MSNWKHHLAERNLMEFNKCEVLQLRRVGCWVNCLDRSTAERDLWVQVDAKLNTRQKCFLPFPARVRRSIVSRLRRWVALPHYSVMGRPHLEHSVEIWALHYKGGNVEDLERVWLRVTKTMKTQVHIFYREKLRDETAHAGKEKAWRFSLLCGIFEWRCKEEGARLFSVTQWQEQRQWTQTETQDVPSEDQ